MTEHKIILRKEQVGLLEKMAVLMEKGGMQPAAAKILALLLVSDEPELTFDEIRETLELSKSATSVVINHLLTTNKIEYKTRIGDRRRFFRSRLMSWTEQIQQDIGGLASVSSFFQEILDQRPDHTPEFNASLHKLIAFLKFMNREMGDLYQRFEEEYN